MPIDEAVNVARQLYCICFSAGGASHSFVPLPATLPSSWPVFLAVMVIPPTSTRARVAPAAKAAFIARVASCRRNVHGPRDNPLLLTIKREYPAVGQEECGMGVSQGNEPIELPLVRSAEAKPEDENVLVTLRAPSDERLVVIYVPMTLMRRLTRLQGN
jgi:hypothetical protein